MAKRFTDTEKWKKPFIRNLPVEYKIFWFYILDDCDHSGVWQIDMEVAEIRLGVKLSLEKARGLFSGKVVEFDSRTKWFIPDFIEFQYGELSEKNKMYKPVTSILKKYNLMGHLSPINGGKVKDKEQVKVKDEDVDVKFSIEHCMEIALNDEKWIRRNNTNRQELEKFNEQLEGCGEHHKNPFDYKRHFYHLKRKRPESVRPLAKQLTMDEWRELAKQQDLKESA